MSLEDLGIKTGNEKAKLLARTLDAATGTLLDNGKGPSARTGELDNRGSHFYLALYWAQALAAQTEDKELQAHFAPLAKALAATRAEDRRRAQGGAGKPADIGGYYLPDLAKTAGVMRAERDPQHGAGGGRRLRLARQATRAGATRTARPA